MSQTCPDPDMSHHHIPPIELFCFCLHRVFNAQNAQKDNLYCTVALLVSYFIKRYKGYALEQDNTGMHLYNEGDKTVALSILCM